MKVAKDEFLIDGGKCAMMTMRRRPLADCSRLELQQPEKARLPTIDSLMGGATRRLVGHLLTAELADRVGQRRRQEATNIVILIFCIF